MSAHAKDSWLSSLEIQNVSRLLYLIRTEQIRPPPNPIPLPSQPEANDRLAVPPIGESHKHHHRSSSASMSTALPPNPLDRRKGSSATSIISSSEVSPGDLRQGKAFDTGCICQARSRKPGLPSRLCVCTCPVSGGVSCQCCYCLQVVGGWGW